MIEYLRMPKTPTGDVYRAIADPRRREILELLGSGEQPVHTLVSQFDVSFAAISQHLGVLRDAGLVVQRPEGRSRLYSATPSGLKEVYDWTAQYRDFWRGKISRLNKYLDEHP
jgi:DNA-binding transcriptional ArsR family regulator